MLAGRGDRLFEGQRASARIGLAGPGCARIYRLEPIDAIGFRPESAQSAAASPAESTVVTPAPPGGVMPAIRPRIRSPPPSHLFPTANAFPHPPPPSSPA